MVDDVQISEAVAAACRGDHASVVSRLTTYTGTNPARAKFVLGNSLYELGQFELALAAFAESRRMGYVDAAYNEGLSLVALGREDEADNAFRRAADLGDPKAIFELAQMAAQRHDWVAACRLADGISSLSEPEMACVDAMAAYWEWEETHSPSLEGRLKAGADVAGEARIALAELHTSRGEIAEAVLTLRAAPADQSIMVCIPLGNLLLEQGDTDGARAAYLRGIQLGDANSHFNLACLLAYEGDGDSAIDHIRRGAMAGDEMAADVLDHLTSLGRRHVLSRLAELAMPSA